MDLVSLVMLFISSGGFAINDYFDRESEAIVYPERAISSNKISPLGVVQFFGDVFRWICCRSLDKSSSSRDYRILYCFFNPVFKFF